MLSMYVKFVGIYLHVERTFKKVDIKTSPKLMT